MCDDEDVCPDGDDNFDADLDGVPNSCDECPTDPDRSTIEEGCVLLEPEKNCGCSGPLTPTASWLVLTLLMVRRRRYRGRVRASTD